MSVTGLSRKVAHGLRLSAAIVLTAVALPFSGVIADLADAAEVADVAEVAAAAIPANTRLSPRTGVSDFEFDSFDAVYRLGIDAKGYSTARVTETLVAIFPEFDQNRGIIRAIPLKDQGYELDVRILSVLDEQGNPVYWERSDSGGFAELALGTDEFVHGRTTYVITYEMRNVIRHFEDSGGDEFYWDINGDGWAQAFRSVSARIELSTQLFAALTGAASCYIGYYGATDTCEISRDGNGFVATSTEVWPYQTMTLAIGFAGGTAVQPQRPQDSWLITKLPWFLFLAMMALVFVTIVLRTVTWRTPKNRRPVIAQYEPPEPRSLMIDGVLLGRSKPVFSAMIVDFAVRGIVNIVDRKGKRPEAHRYAVALQQRDAAGPNEHRVLDALFQDQAKNNPVVTPSLMPSSAGAAVYSALGKAPGMATTAGLRHQPVSVWPKWVRRSSNWLLLAFVVPFGWSILHDLEPDSILGAGFLSLIGKFTVSGLSVLPWLLTESGVQRRDHLRGIRLYLTVAEQERMRILQSPEGAERVARILGEVVGPGGVNQVQVVKLNEKLLPWAVLWGVEQQWSKVLSAGYVAAGTAPNWVSTATIDSQFWRWSASNNARIAPLSTPSSGGFSWSGSGGSSSFSGSSGGGFSGGGGGGGGGGGR